MRIFVRGVFFAALLMCFGCSEQTDITPKIEKENQFSIKQAKEAFVRDYTAAVEAKETTTRAHKHIHYTLADTDYTPLWDKAVSSENDHIVSIDVPIYSTAAAFVSNGNGENMRMTTQKLVFIQNKESKETYSYLLTLCPDEECANKYADLNKVFIHAGDKSQFSGVAIYTDLEGGLVAMAQYVLGKEYKYTYVGAVNVADDIKSAKIESILADYTLYLSTMPITRGGADYIYENLCADCLLYPCHCSDLGIGDYMCQSCNNFYCTCNPCPKCGSISCTGCETDGGSGDMWETGETCEYCGYDCNHSCNAYCAICEVLKNECTSHYCSECGQINSDCECKE